MNTGRAEVIGLLQVALPNTIAVIQYQQGLDNLKKPTVMVVVNEVTPSAVRKAAWNYQFDLYAMVPQTAKGTSDDALDDLMEVVLNALEGSAIPNGVTWTKATRATFEEKFPAYNISINVLITRD